MTSLQTPQSERPSAAGDDVFSHRRVGLNAITNIVRMGVNAIIGVVFVPYIVRSIGVAGYGVVALAYSLSLGLRFVTHAVNSAFGRFLTLELRQGDDDAANRCFNSGLVLALAAGAVGLVLAVALGFAGNLVFSMPAGHEGSARWVLAASFVAASMTIVRGILDCSAFAMNRLDASNMIYLTNSLVYVVSLVVLFQFVNPSLVHVGTAFLLGALVSLFLSYRLWRRLTPQLHMRLSQCDKGFLRSLLGMGTWVTLNQVGAFLFLQVELVIVNWTLGAAIQGRYAAVQQWAVFLRMMAGTAAAVVAPLTVNLVAVHDYRRLAHVQMRATRGLGLLLAGPLGLLCGFGQPLLTLWLGPDFADLHILLIVTTVHLSLNLTVTPLFSVQTAFNRVAAPGIATIIGGVANVALALSLARVWPATGMGVAVAGAIMLSAKNSIFTPWHVAKILDLPRWTFLVPLGLSMVCTLLLGASAYGLNAVMPLTSWPRLVLYGLGAGGLYYGLVYVLVLRADERAFLWRFCKRTLGLERG